MTETRAIPDRGYPAIWAAEVQRDGSGNLEIAIVAGAPRRGANTGSDPLSISYSLDAGSTWHPFVSLARPGTFGSVAVAPADSSVGKRQEFETAELWLDSGELESATLERLTVQGSNRIHWGEEVGAFTTATAGALPGRWIVGDLYRGLASTETEPEQGFRSKTWALLDGDTSWVGIEDSWIGQTLTLAPSSSVWPIESHTVRAEVLIDGRSGRPMTPFGLIGAWVGGDLVTSWNAGRELFANPTEPRTAKSRPDEWFEIEHQRTDTTWRRTVIGSAVTSDILDSPQGSLSSADAATDGHADGDPIEVRVRSVNYRGESPWFQRTLP